MVALTAAFVSLTLLPALLAVLGPRVNALSPKRWRVAMQRDAAHVHDGPWYRLSRAVMRRPGPIAIAAALVLVVLGLPFLRVQFTGVDASVLPEQRSAKVVDEALTRGFPPGPTTPILVAAHAGSDRRADVEAYAQQLSRLPGVASVAPPVAARGLWRIDVVPRGAELSASSKQLVRDIRAARAPFAVDVGGGTAGFLDQQTSLAASLPLALAILATTTLLILFAMTGSVVLPVKALLMNLLTVSAAFGLLVLIFQDGRLEGLLGYQSQHALEATQPVLLFCAAFGLSTDYGVFLLTRIKEARDAGAGERESVALGLERTGRIVTYAAVLFCIAIGAFATSQVVFIKEVGIGTALAVLIDAFLVRALLVPSLMALLGRWNWWAPRPLARLHARLGLREAPA
jgi:RND superfamily putative drug exporter